MLDAERRKGDNSNGCQQVPALLPPKPKRLVPDQWLTPGHLGPWLV